MAYNSEHKNASFGTAGAKFNLNTGPTIASYVDYRSPSMEDDVQSQFLLLDGVVPSAMRDFAANSLAAFAGGRLKMNAKQLERMALDSRAGGAHPEGALAHTALYFACGHDSAGGRYELKSGAEGARETRLKWDRVTEEPTFRRINSTIEGYANALGGVFIANPRTTVFGQRIQATHPLGGCPMGGSATSGVVNHSGQVYSRGGALHAGLYVVDAAIIPRSLAATPLLTISALAERIAVLVSKET